MPKAKNVLKFLVRTSTLGFIVCSGRVGCAGSKKIKK